MYISLTEHCIAVTQLKVTVCHIFISQLKIYKEKENLSINISIKSQPVFLSASRSGFARATSFPKVSPSRRRKSGSSSMITGFASPMTVLKQIFKRLIIFYLNTHTHTHTHTHPHTQREYESEHRSNEHYLGLFFTFTPKKHKKKKTTALTIQQERGKTKRKKF